MADVPAAQPLDEGLRWLDRLEAAAAVKSVGAWPLQAILEHLSQGIEMSMDGFPAGKGPLFQRTLGRGAFSVFRMRGRMSHGLAQPIPGAPSLSAGADWAPGALRLRRAILRFKAHDAPLAPHFAYGPLSRRDFALAHRMHIANHGDEIIVA